MKLSLIIPTYNEAATLDACLEQLAKLPPDWEILFADGGSSDGTPQRIAGHYRVLPCPKGRARQMNAAARHAQGDYLFFLHCDSRLPPNAASLLEAAMAQGRDWGCFCIAFDYHGPFMGCNTFFSNLRARRGIAFGDQGIWIRRQLFEQLGGFPDLPLMEDYELSRRLRARRVPICLLPAAIVTSGRRYRGHFPLWTMAQMAYLRCLYRAGVDIEDIARRYKDIR